MNPIVKFGLLALVTALSACSMLQSDKIDYKSAGKGASLEVPPDLTQLSRDSRYIVPGSGTITASSYAAGATVAGVPTAAMAIGDVRIERAGNQRWLVVNRPADQLFGQVRDFWLENGFLITTDQPTLGILETDWAENRAKIPQDLIRSTLGRVLDQAYSTAERDRFRTRLERSATGGTEIFISHRGMQEVYSTTQKDQTMWQPRAADPELEAEFLRRLMVRLGVSQEATRALVAGAAGRATSRIETVNNTPVVVIDEAFDRAWRRVGLALDRTGFTVEDRDRAGGTYFVRYVPPSADKKDPGFLGRLFSFSSPDKENPVKYRIAVKGEGQKTTVSVLNDKGAPEQSQTAQRIVQVIADDLK